MKTLRWKARVGLAALLLLISAGSAGAANLLNVVLTTAVATTTGPVMQFRYPQSAIAMTISCVFTYGSGGTSADAWVQTSLDGGTTWNDVAQCHVTTANLTQAFNLSTLTSTTTPVATTDGALAVNTAVGGIFGPLWRVKYSSTGTYAGNTRFTVNTFSTGNLTRQ